MTSAVGNTADYVVTGALLWQPWVIDGIPYAGCYVSWPFVQLRISPGRIRLTVNFPWIVHEAFELQKMDIRAIRWQRVLFSKTISFEHQSPDSPLVLRFYSFKQREVWCRLRSAGYPLIEP